MGSQEDADLYISALTVGEIQRGILDLPLGKKRKDLENWFSGQMGPAELFGGRILPFDEPAALIWAQLMADGKRIGRPRSALDMMVAAIASVHGCVIVTDNEKDFSGIEILNPLRL